MRIKQITLGPIEENTYIVNDANGEAALIDCGCWNEREWMIVQDYVQTNHLRIIRLLNTHLHFDHSLGHRFVLRDYGLKAEAAAADFFLYENMKEQLERLLGPHFADKMDLSFTHALGTPLEDGQEIHIGSGVLQVIATPGHTPGGVCFYDEEDAVLLSGDTLFQGSIGRTDLEGGDYATLVKSITKRLLNLPPQTIVHAGHGPSTTIEHELNYNPYL